MRTHVEYRRFIAFRLSYYSAKEVYFVRATAVLVEAVHKFIKNKKAFHQ